MSPRKKGLIISVIVILIAVISITFSSQFSNKDNNVLRCSIPEDPKNLDAHKNMDDYGISLNVFNRLVEYEQCTKDLTQISESLAEKYNISIDGLTYTFYLRENVKFHNGNKFTAEDVVYTFNRILDPKTKSEGVQYLDMVTGAKDKLEGKANEVSGIKALDENTVEITLEKRYAPFMAGLATTACSIYDKETSEKEGGIGKSPGSTVGTGPFILKEWKQGKSIYLEANKDYFLEAPKINGISYKVVKDIKEREKLFKSGNLDILDLTSNVSSLKNFNGESKDVVTLPSGSGYCYMLNESIKPFDDLRVRRAIQMAIDRKKLIDDTYLGYGTIINGIVPNEILSYNPELQKIKYNKEKAIELLRDGGYSEGFELELSEIAGSSNYIHMINEEFKKMLGEIGIKVNIKQIEEKSFEDLKKDGKLSLYLHFYEENINDPDAYMHAFLTPENRANYNNINVVKAIEIGRSMTDTRDFLKLFYRYERVLSAENKNSDNLIKETIDTFAKTVHPRDRIKFYNNIEERIVHEDASIVPLFSPHQVYVVNQRIKNFDLKWNGYNKMPLYRIYISEN